MGLFHDPGRPPQAQQAIWHGASLGAINPPVAAASLALSVCLLALIVSGHYTGAVASSGYLGTGRGVPGVFAPQPGVIDQEADQGWRCLRVAKGQTLFVLSADREGREREPLYAVTTETLRDRRAKMADTIEDPLYPSREIVGVRRAARTRSPGARCSTRRSPYWRKRSICARGSSNARRCSLAPQLLTADESEQAELGLLDERAQLSRVATRPRNRVAGAEFVEKRSEGEAPASSAMWSIGWSASCGPSTSSLPDQKCDARTSSSHQRAVCLRRPGRRLASQSVRASRLR